MAEREDLLQFLSRSSIPIVLIHGELDVLIPISRSKEIKRQSRLRVIGAARCWSYANDGVC